MKGMPHFRQYPMGDVVNANLEPGEYVVRRNAVNALGVDNMELLNHADGAHGNLNKLIVSADLENKLVQDNAPVKSDVNGYPIADSPVRQRVDATRQMQDGGEVEEDPAEEGRGLMDYIHGGLDVAGMVPGFGIIPDIANAALYGGEALMAGDDPSRSEALALMGLSGAAAIPIAGQAATAGKWAVKSAKGAKRMRHMGKQSKGAQHYIKTPSGKHIPFSEKSAHDMYEKTGKFPEGYQVDYPEVGNIITGKTPRYTAMITPSGKHIPTGYQDGGEVSKTIRGARPVEYNYDDPEMLRGLFSVPASEVGGGEGLRYYSAEKAQGRMPSLDRRVLQARAAQKMAFSPADSIPSAMVEGYFDEPSKASGFLKRLGINKQEGGPVRGYQDGGRIKKIVSSETRRGGDRAEYDMEYMPSGKVKARGLFPMPAELTGGEGGDRWYLGEGEARNRDFAKSRALSRAQFRMASTPADSIPAAMVESYFDDPDGYKEGGEVRDVPSGNWGPKGAYNEALAASRDSTISEQELKSMALMDHFRKMGAGERLESSDMYNGKPTYKSEEAYKRAFGMQTPLNAKERFTQARLGLNPEMFTAQQKGLLGKVLLQRLGNEVQ